LADKIPGRALVFTYRRLNRFLHQVAERTFEGPVTCCSSWPGLEPVNLQDRFYVHYREQRPAPEPDMEEIVTRCCVLRLLPKQQAVRMAHAMYWTIDELTDQVRPDFLFTVMVDNYMTDLLARICRRKGARRVMLAAGCVPDTIIVTAYGEFNKVRDPPESEVEQALLRFSDDGQRVVYDRPFSGYGPWTHLKICATWWAKAVSFRAAGAMLGDPLNFRFLMGSLADRDGQSSPWGYRCTRYFDAAWEERVRASGKPKLFIPLAYTPEAPVQYWPRDLRYIDYESFILETCRSLARTHLVLVKEHWSALGVRLWRFYEALSAIEGVVLIPAEVNSRQVMSMSDGVLVGGGTAGIEAAVRGKRVVTLERPYYFLDGHYLELGSSKRIGELPELLESFSPPPLTPEGQRAVVRRALEPTLRGHFLPGPDIDTEENYRNSTESLKVYLASGGGCSR
jgi:hypothetical protein